MSFFRKILGLENQATKTRVRVCVECGMPVAEHKDWCSIFRTQQEMDQKGTALIA